MRIQFQGIRDRAGDIPVLPGDIPAVPGDIPAMAGKKVAATGHAAGPGSADWDPRLHCSRMAALGVDARAVAHPTSLA